MTDRDCLMNTVDVALRIALDFKLSVEDDVIQPLVDCEDDVAYTQAKDKLYNLICAQVKKQLTEQMTGGFRLNLPDLRAYHEESGELLLIMEE